MNGAVKLSGRCGRCRISRSDKVAGSIHLVELEIRDCPVDLERPRPGQFFQVKCADGPEHILRRPLSVHGITQWDEPGHSLELLVEDVGWGTHRLCSLSVGSEVELLGPLGRGFEMPRAGKALLVAGGMGIAPLFFMAREMDHVDAGYDLVAGFKSGDCAYAPLACLKGGGVLCTEDGSAGEKGTAVGKAAGYMERSVYSMIYVCGPEAMMAEMSRLAEKADIPCQVSLVSRMACGIGVCRGCARPGRNGDNLCVCREGPVFDSTRVEWICVQ
ncbi:MAG: dihydroorotate dehydrogenase electron transfer subunit [Actinobacteria bacterium]|nr:dihydroorotate dehydrogenase electron transfer subunit [Actinomycetota bacterium]